MKTVVRVVAVIFVLGGIQTLFTGVLTSNYLYSLTSLVSFIAAYLLYMSTMDTTANKSDGSSKVLSSIIGLSLLLLGAAGTFGLYALGYFTNLIHMSTTEIVINLGLYVIMVSPFLIGGFVLLKRSMTSD